MNKKIWAVLGSGCCLVVLTNCNMPDEDLDIDDFAAEYELMEAEIEGELEALSGGQGDCGGGGKPGNWQKPDGGQGGQWEQSPERKACHEEAKECRQKCLAAVTQPGQGDEIKQCHDAFKECRLANAGNKKQCKREFRDCRKAATSDLPDEDRADMKACMMDCKDVMKGCMEAL